MPQHWTNGRLFERPAFAKDAVLFAALVGLMTACMSVPEGRYYTLDMRDSESAQPTFQVEVARFQTSDALSKPEILIQATPTRVEYYAVDRWASNLAEMVQEKLQVEFGPAGTPKFRIEGDILGFEQIDSDGGADARAKLRVRVYDSAERRSSEPLLRKTYEETVPSESAKPDDIVLALSRALEGIASQIVSDLGTL